MFPRGPKIVKKTKINIITSPLALGCGRDPGGSVTVEFVREASKPNNQAVVEGPPQEIERCCRRELGRAEFLDSSAAIHRVLLAIHSFTEVAKCHKLCAEVNYGKAYDR